MPPADQSSDWNKPTRTFLYGPDKTKKTWWACRAAVAGFNVLLIDGDNGSSIVNQLPLEARKRILIVDAVNLPDRMVFPQFCATFFRGDPFVWDEQAKRSYPLTFKRDINHSHIIFNPNRFTTNDLIVGDSWTRLADALAMEWARENNVDLTQIDKDWDQFALMGYQSRFLDYVLNKLGTFPCHMMWIGHETVYEKFGDRNGKRTMIEQKTQPFSSTGPHAKKIGAHFSNVLRFKKMSDINFTIDAGGDATTMGGARQLAPKMYKWDDISPATIFEAVGFKGNPNQPMLGATWLPAGTEQNLIAAKPATNQPAAPVVPAPAPVVDAGSAATSLINKTSLLKKK